MTVRGTLDPRQIAYLRESDALDGTAVVDYVSLNPADLGESHAGALLDALELGRTRALVSLREVVSWRAKMGAGQGLLSGREPSLELLLADIRGMLPGLADAQNAFGGSAFAADAMRSFLSLRPFGDANGRTGRLLFSYLFAYMRQALMIFRVEEKEQLEAGVADPRAMRTLVMQKTRETMVAWNGEVWERARRYESADAYSSPDGKGRIVLECHELLDFIEADAVRPPPRETFPPALPGEREPCIVFVEGGRGRGYVFPIGEFVIGRDESCNVVIRDVGLSRRHAKLTVTADTVTITDLGSKGGMIVDSRPVATATLRACTEIVLGTVKVTFGESRAVSWPQAMIPLLAGAEWILLPPTGGPIQDSSSPIPTGPGPQSREGRSGREAAGGGPTGQRGMVFGSYRLLSAVSKTEHEVYRAIDLSNGSDVIVRVWPRTVGQATEPEWGPLLELSHPNVVRLLRTGTVGESHFAALEPWTEDLRDLLRRSRSVLRERLALIDGLCSGVAAAHARDILHGDLGARHVRLDARGALRVDFSESWYQRACGEGGRLAPGRADVLPPEEVSSPVRRPSQATDRYCAAALAYEILTGRAVFQAETLQALIYRMTHEDPPDPRRTDPDVPAEIAHWVLKGLARDPEARFGSAAEMKDSLAAIRGRS